MRIDGCLVVVASSRIVVSHVKCLLVMANLFVLLGVLWIWGIGGGVDSVVSMVALRLLILWWCWGSVAIIRQLSCVVSVCALMVTLWWAVTLIMVNVIMIRCGCLCNCVMRYRLWVRCVALVTIIVMFGCVCGSL